MEFRQLEAFVAVADRKSFSFAAEALFLSQSTVSSHIKNLEKELNKSLILRTTKTLRLTQDGEMFLRYARRIVDTRDAALASMEQAPRQMLRLGASSIPSAYLLPGILKRFHAVHPTMRFDIRQGDSEIVQEMVQDGVVDIGLLGKRYGSAQCEYIPLCEDELVLVTPTTPAYQQLRRDNAPLHELLRCPMIVREQGSATQNVSAEILANLGVPAHSLNIIAYTDGLEPLKMLITQGLGVSICSRFSVQELSAQQRVYLYPLPTQVKRFFYLVYSTQRSHSPALQQFIDCATALYDGKRGI